VAEPIIIVDYDPDWATSFTKLRDRIGESLRDLPHSIDHVGGTAIPGAAAKPIIDIDVVLKSKADTPKAIEALAKIGYRHLGDLGIAGREAFESPTDPVPHHLYVVALGGREHTRHVKFRDYLRSHPEETKRYSALKKSLAQKFRNDREAYTESKTVFIEAILRQAGSPDLPPFPELSSSTSITSGRSKRIIQHFSRSRVDLSQGSVNRFFAEHAQDYSRSQSHAQGADLGALIRALKPKKSEVVLDVATGTGFTAVALAGLVGHVTGIDVTDEMLTQAGRLARERGLANVRFELGDALKIGYPNSSFDVVTTRRATHHFEDVPRFLREAKRVLRSGGRLGIVDMSPLEGAEAFSNRIERLRDRSHVRAFTQTAWKSMVSKAGFFIQSSEILGESITFERWLYPVEAGGREGESIRRAWSSAPTNVKRLLAARFEKGVVKGWTKSRIILVASKTP
jgi:GrpB-like predicted nucleotidyltransferase (UPF0157 family)/ubiquinone/menaquinone biosynthesis C-methylase UbiE